MLAGGGGRVKPTITISASTQNYTANTSKVTGYVPGGTDVTFVINSGVVVGSASTGSYAFTVDTSWNVNDSVTITNAGTVIGAGGNGGVTNDGLNGSNSTFGSINVAGGGGGGSSNAAVSSGGGGGAGGLLASTTSFNSGTSNFG